MRVVFIQDYLRNGGTENQTIHTAQCLAHSGIETHLIVFRRSGFLDDKAKASDIHIHFLAQGMLKTDWHAPRLTQTLQHLEPDFVIAMGKMANCHLGLLARKKRNYQLISTFRTGKKIPFLYRRALRNSSHIVSNSAEALERLKTIYKIDRPENSSVIYNGCIRDFETTIPTLEACSPVPLFHIVCVSMFRPEKQQIRLIRICSRLPKSINWKLTLAGEGAKRSYCQEEARKLGIADKVHFPGLLKDPRSLYADADIAVHASDSESLPNFLVEAQMAGIPVVAYNTGGVAETFRDQKSGYLIEHGDENTFLQRIEELAKNEALRLQMSQAARDYAQLHFTSNAQLRAFQDLFASLMSH